MTTEKHSNIESVIQNYQSTLFFIKVNMQELTAIWKKLLNKVKRKTPEDRLLIK